MMMNEMSAERQDTLARKRFDCPVDGFQQIMNGKYKLRILWDLQDGPHRYGEIKKGLLRDISGSPEYHMHHSVITIIDANHHTEDWTFMMKDKPIHAHFDLHRAN